MNELGWAFAIANLWGQCYNDGTYTNRRFQGDKAFVSTKDGV